MTTTGNSSGDSSGPAPAHQHTSAPGPAAPTGQGALLPKLTWLAAILLPPSAVAGVWRDVVRHHVVLACGGFLLYWVILTAGKFAVDFARDLVLRRRAGWLESADQHLARLFSGFDRTYKEYLAASMRFMDQRGLSVIGPFAPELDEVFVDVSLALQAPGRIAADLLGAAGPVAMAGGTDERRYIGDFLDRPEPRVLAIVGAPGTGKTTLLRHVARRACLAAPADRQRGVPALLYLRSLVAELAENPRLTLAEAIRSGLGQRISDGEPPGWFEARLSTGDCVVLLDGLDEVAEESMRHTLVAWVEQQISSYPQNDYVLTSRPHGYRSAPVEGATVLQTRHFTEQQVSDFIGKWYLAVEQHARHDADSTATAIRLRAEEGAADLQARLRATPHLYDLTVNPLLLTMIANVHRYRGALPGTRADLYREICQAMLWRRQASKRLVVEPRGTQKETVLRGLAFAMMERRTAVVSRYDCVDILGGILPRISESLTAEEFLTDVGTSGLLLERENGVFAFAHFTIQEYLAAEHIRDKGLSRLLAEAVDDDWWRECTLLYSAGADVGPIVAACLHSGTITALALAFDCADEGNELDPELRARLNDLLRRSSSADMTAEERRLMNGVLVTRRLRHVLRTADDGRLCASPVDPDVYGRYLLDRAEHGARRPDSASAAGEPGRPVTGVRGQDALAFVGWLNDLVGGESRYRLPTVEEARDPAIRGILSPPAPAAAHGRADAGDQGGYSFWCIDESGGAERPQLWVPPGVNEPRSLPTRELTGRIHEDFAGFRYVLATLVALRAHAALAVMSSCLRGADGSAEAGSVLAHVLALLEDLAVNESRYADAFLEIGSRAVLDVEFARVRAVAAELSTREDPLSDGDLPLVLAEDVVRELSALAETLASHPLVAELGITVQAAVKLRDRLAQGRAPVLEPLVRRVTSADMTGGALHASNDPVVVARSAVYRLATGRVLPLAAAQFSARIHTESALGTQSPWAVFLDALTRFHLPEYPSSRSVVVDPDELLDALPGVLRELANATAEHPSAVWFDKLLRTVWAHVLPILRRDRPPQGPDLQKARLAVACLAAEEHLRVVQPGTDDLNTDGTGLARRDLTEPLRRTAAALTWLEDRHTGARPATEAIVLAVD